MAEKKEKKMKKNKKPRQLVARTFVKKTGDNQQLLTQKLQEHIATIKDNRKKLMDEKRFMQKLGKKPSRPFPSFGTAKKKNKDDDDTSIEERMDEMKIADLESDNDNEDDLKKKREKKEEFHHPLDDNYATLEEYGHFELNDLIGFLNVFCISITRENFESQFNRSRNAMLHLCCATNPTLRKDSTQVINALLEQSLYLLLEFNLPNLSLQTEGVLEIATSQQIQTIPSLIIVLIGQCLNSSIEKFFKDSTFGFSLIRLIESIFYQSILSETDLSVAISILDTVLNATIKAGEYQTQNLLLLAKSPKTFTSCILQNINQATLVSCTHASLSSLSSSPYSSSPSFSSSSSSSSAMSCTSCTCLNFQFKYNKQTLTTTFNLLKGLSSTLDEKIISLLIDCGILYKFEKILQNAHDFPDMKESGLFILSNILSCSSSHALAVASTHCLIGTVITGTSLSSLESFWVLAKLAQRCDDELIVECLHETTWQLLILRLLEIFQLDALKIQMVQTICDGFKMAMTNIQNLKQRVKKSHKTKTLKAGIDKHIQHYSLIKTRTEQDGNILSFQRTEVDNVLIGLSFILSVF